MTRQELEKHLACDAEDGFVGFHWGVYLQSRESVISLALVRWHHQEPHSVYTPIGMSEEGEQWQGFTELWEVKWRSFYQLLVVEFARRPLDIGEDPRDYPQETDYLRCESRIAGGLDELEEALSKYGKALTDVGSVLVPRVPCVTTT